MHRLFSMLKYIAQETNDTLWQALQKVNLHTYVTSMPDIHIQSAESAGASSGSISRPVLAEDGIPDLSLKIVTEKGSNLSVGQRQLLCLARAIVKYESIK